MASDGAVRRDDLESALLRLGQAGDCVVLERTVAGMSPGPILTAAYVVPLAGAAPEVVREQATACLAGGGAAMPAVVLVRRIPRAADGSPDVATLTALPAVTDEAFRAYAERVAEQDVKVELRQVAGSTPMVRLADWDAESDTGMATRAPRATADLDTAQVPEPVTPQRLSVVEGPPLEVLDGDPATVTEAILTSVDRFPQLGLRLVSRGGDPFLAYPDVLAQGKRVLGGLHARGLAPGSRAIVLVPTLTDYFPAIWGCVLGGIVPLTVSTPATFDRPSPVLDKLLHAWRALGRPVILTDKTTAVVVDALRRLCDEPDAVAVTVEQLTRAEPSDDVYRAGPDDVAMFTLSSGSTGRSKVIQVTHRAIVENALAMRQRRLVLPGEVTFNWLPYDHVVPKVTFLLRDVILGCTGVHAPTSYVVGQPLRWLEVLERYRVQHSWSPNFGYRMIADALAAQPERHFDLAHVRTLFNAGEQCMPPVIRDFLARTAGFGLDAADVVNEWGMAETGTCVTDKRFDRPGSVRRILKSTVNGRLREAGAGVEDTACLELMSMGPPAAGVGLRVTDAEHRVLPEGVIGHLQARATRVTPGYLNSPQANAEAFTADGWFDTGDLAFIMDGEVIITGRAKELIVINGEKYFCHEIEGVCGGLDGVRTGLVAACGVPDVRSGTEVLAVFFVPERPSPGGTAQPPLELIERVRAAVATRLQLTAGYVLPLTEDEFPRTTSGKIQRAALVKRMVAGEFDDLVARVEAARGTANLAPDCVFMPGWQAGQQRPSAAPEPAGGLSLVFADDLGLAERLFTVDRHATGTTIAVRRGEGYRAGPDGYRIDPERPDDWAALRCDLDRRGLRPDTLLYLWSYLPAPDPAGDRAAVHDAAACCGRYLVACCSTFLRPDSAGPPRLLTVSRQRYRVTGEEEVCYPAAQTVAVAATLARELPDAHVHHIDLAGLSIVEDADTLRCARTDLGATGTESVWRHGRPYLPTLTPVAEPPAARDALVRGGVYLVAGGGGGIGARLLAELADRYAARFLVLGRRDPSIDPDLRAAWAVLDTPGREVAYRVADVLDARAVTAAAAAAEEKWGRPLDGVVHLADSYRMRLLPDEDPADWDPARLAKLSGTLNLLDVVRARPGARLLVFSSLLGSLASASCARYGAGNAFADALVDHVVSRHGVPATSLAWGLWHGVGINRDNPYEAAVTRRGVLSLAPEQAALLARLVLRQEPGVFHIGLDAAAPHVRGRIATADELCLERPVVVGGTSLDPVGLPDLTDPFGVPLPVDIEEAAEVSAGLSAAEAELLTALQAALARFVARPIGPASRLPELGISSVQMMQLHTHLEDVLDRDIPKAALFRHPTIGDLVRYLLVQPAEEEMAG